MNLDPFDRCASVMPAAPEGRQFVQCRLHVDHVLRRPADSHWYEMPGGEVLRIPVAVSTISSVWLERFRKNIKRPLLIRKNIWGQWVWICRVCHAKAEAEMRTELGPESFIRYLTHSRNLSHQQALTEALTHYGWNHS